MKLPRSRIGAVEYLNTKPLVFGLADRLPDWELVFDLPSRLADDLALGNLEVALIPSIEFLQHGDYEVVSDAAIACRGPVWSVRLLSRVHPSQIHTLALDEGSRTSVALVQILLWEEFQLRPSLVSLPIDQELDSVEADAALLIGDRAMRPSSRVFVKNWDLGQWWCQQTGLPFVFAVWAAKKGSVPVELAVQLSLARDEGVTQLDQIARQEAFRHGLSHEQCRDYFEKNLHFTLGCRERSGLREFARRVQQLELNSNTVKPAAEKTNGMVQGSNTFMEFSPTPYTDAV
jgi:chorismate dehydratase